MFDEELIFENPKIKMPEIKFEYEEEKSKKKKEIVIEVISTKVGKRKRSKSD